MKYKLLVADFDDTTVSDDLVISDKVRCAINKYRERGGIFTFCTGRMIEGIIGYARDLGLNGDVIGYQGGEVADILTGKILFKHVIPYPVASDICKYLDSFSQYYQVYDSGCFYVKEDNEYARAYEVFTGTKMRVAGINLNDFMNTQKISPVKIMLRIDPEKTQQYLFELQHCFGDRVNVNTSKSHLIEIVDINVDKGKAVCALGKRLGIEKHETVCIGDALSDVPMIKFAGLGVCVSNGSEAAQKAAKLIVPSCREDGLAYLINNYCL